MLRRGCLGYIVRKLLSLVLVLGILAYPFLEPYWLRVDAHTVSSPQLPAAFDGLRVVFVSDLHVGPFYSHDRLATLFDQINAQQPDLVLLGGDYADDSAGAVAFFEQMPPLRASLGVFAVPGNHDRVLPESNLPYLLAAMERAGVTPLCNTALTISRDGQRLTLAGVDEYANGHPDFAGVAVQTRAEDYTIFMIHNPDGIPRAFLATDANGRTGWADLILCGHTHGGQVTLFGQRALLFDINKETGERFRTGWKREEGADILISNGVGTSFLPIRFFAWPQLHVMTLRRG